MLGLLTAMSIGLNAVVLAQLVAPGPASPDPTPYGVGPGGIRVAPGAAARGTGSGVTNVPITSEARRGKRDSIAKRCLRPSSRAASLRHAKRRSRAC
jgi:hypothetical protein